MKLTKIECPQCGAPLERAEGARVKCSYCGSEFSVEEGSGGSAKPEARADSNRGSGQGKSSRGALQLLVILAMLTAMEVVLNRFLSINTAGWKIGFAFIPPTVAAMLYGPIPSAIVYALGDFIGAMLFPIGTYHPGFTICAAAMGIVAGVFLNRRPLGIFGSRLEWKNIKLFPNYIAVVVINCLIIGLFINTEWVAMLYGSRTYWGWFLYRLPEYAIMVPVQLVIFPILKKVSDMLYNDGIVKLPWESGRKKV